MGKKIEPRVSILDRRFKYRDSAHTDVRVTWRRAQLASRKNEQPASAVVQIRKKASC